MGWISGIGRDGDGQLCVQAQGLDGKRALKDLRTLGAELAVPGGVRRKVVLPLHEMRVGDTREYLRALGLDVLDAGAQPVYETTTDAGA